MQEKMTYKTIKQSVHFNEIEWGQLKNKKAKAEKDFGYKISVNKFLRKIILEEALNGRR